MRQILEEGLDQASLTDARGSLDHHHRGAAFAHTRVGAVEGLHFLLATEHTQHGNANRRMAAGDRGGALTRDHAETGQNFRARRPLGWIAVEEPHAQFAQQIVGLGVDSLRRRRILALLFEQHLEQCSVEGAAAGEHLVDHGADRVPIGGRQARPFQGLLGCHVGRRAGHAIGRHGSTAGLLGEAKVQDHHAAFFGHQHIGGLEIAVNRSRLVDGVNTVAKLPNRAQGPLAVRRGGWIGGLRRGQGDAHVGWGEMRAQIAIEGHALDVFHGEEPQRTFGDEFVQLDQIDVLEIQHGAKLALELVEIPPIREVEDLERDLRLELLIVDQIHATHPTGAEVTDDLESRCP